jgi:hypothetical protein
MKPQLQSLINDTAGGYVQVLAGLINNALLHVSRGLTSLSDVSVPEITRIPNEIHYSAGRGIRFIVAIFKSLGPDEIPNWFLKEFAFAVANPVCHIFNE